MNRWLHTTRFSRRKLPHWEVSNGRYFITVRCADSLPAKVTIRLQEIHETLRLIEPASENFAALQRAYFRMMEKYLDAATGECPLRDPHAASLVAAELQSLTDWQIDVPHYSIMPNHWQSEWFDRWMRDDSEYEKCVNYIRNNPVRAGLVARIDEHPWTT